MFGLSDSHWGLVKELLVSPLKKNDAKLWVFGSRARGDHKKYSDLDILVEWAQPNEKPIKLLQDIREKLEESRLPITVDIVDFNELAKSYLSGILKERVQI